MLNKFIIWKFCSCYVIAYIQWTCFVIIHITDVFWKDLVFCMRWLRFDIIVNIHEIPISIWKSDLYSAIITIIDWQYIPFVDKDYVFKNTH